MFCEMSFHFARAVLPKSKRNIASVLLTGSSWISLLTQALALVNGPADGKPSTRRALRRFSDFMQRESDICVSSVLFMCLQAISVLPIAYIHSQLIVNYAFATSLRVVQTRQRLMLSVYQIGWLRAPARGWAALQRATIWVSLRACIQRLLMLCLPVVDDSASSSSRVFVPTVVMPERLNRPGPFEMERKWAKPNEVRFQRT